MLSVKFLFTTFLLQLARYGFCAVNTNLMDAAFSLFKTSYEQNSTTKNFMISPYSIRQCLSMMYHGTKCRARQQLDDLFNYSDATIQPIVGYDALYEANKVYVSNLLTIKQSYTDKLGTLPNVGVEDIDFTKIEAVVETVNTFISDSTDNKLTDVLKETHLDGSEVLILVNAIYFKAAWLYTFDPNDNETNRFTKLDGTNINVDFMANISNYKRADFQDYNCAGVRLPYENGRSAMYLILPDDGINLTVFMGSITTENLKDILDTIYQTDAASTTVYVPKFETEVAFVLTDPLMSLNVKKIFRNPDLSKMLPNAGPVSVNTVLHSVYMKVDEEGTTAAAATMVVARGRSSMGYTLRFNNPFLYVIVDETTGTPLFMGEVDEPPVSTDSGT